VARPILPTACVPPSLLLPLAEAAEKILLMVTEQINSSYGKRTFSNWHMNKPALEEIENEIYRTRVKSKEALV